MIELKRQKPISQIREEERQSPEARIAQLEEENADLHSTIQKLQNDRKTLMLAVTELYELLIQQQQSGGTS
ncbi:hypothetical protein [Brevibacillus thermoruber]|uniref:hypothetical protein n=1 Tax=Brevibacillus thermoruber TaxID=33942 RepID=UPI000553FF6B|nr:hypothetical protein [Brevibacillus thermoruber]